MEEIVPLAELVQRWRAGDPQAPAQLYARYARQLTRLAEQHLSRKLAGRVDGEDVVQSVFRTFFRRSARGEFAIDSASQLWRLLVRITLSKVRAKARFHTARRRAVQDEARGEDGWLAEAVAREPDPAEAVALVDQIEDLLRGLPDVHCHVLELRLQGYSVTEIAERLNVARQTVYRTLHVLQHRLQRGEAEEENLSGL
jgi:RNA polymerase sigma-70 factor (ECF subfamily)